MAAIPLCYLYLYEDEDYQYFIVSEEEYDENYKAYAHTNANGTILNEIFLSIYEGYVSSSKLRSISGYEPTNQYGMENKMTYAQANGSGWDIRSWSQRILINVLLTLMSKSTNGQLSFGVGYTCDPSATATSSGLGNSKGQFWGENVGTKAYNATLKTFHIENWWGNRKESISGFLLGGNVGKGVRVKMTPPYNTTGTDYTLMVPEWVDAGMGGWYIGGGTTNEYGFFPHIRPASGGSSTTYWADRCYHNGNAYSSSTIYCAYVGGYSYMGAGSGGPWYISFNDHVSEVVSEDEACLSFIALS